MADGKPPTTSSWIASDRPIPHLIARPLRDFLDTEISSGIVLLVATAVALVWANSPWGAAYDALHSYEPIFWVFTGLSALSVLAVLPVRRETLQSAA